MKPDPSMPIRTSCGHQYDPSRIPSRRWPARPPNRRPCAPEVVEHRLRGGRPDARHAERHDLEQRVERPDAAGRLDLDMWRGVGPHQPEVVVGRAARREPGRGLDEVAAGSLGEAAGPDLLVVGQVGVLEDDLDDRAGVMGDLDDRGDVGADVGVAPGLQGADLDDHVELGRAVGQRPARLEDLGLGRGDCRAGSRSSSRPRRRCRPGSPPRATTSAGRTQTEATSYSAASRQPSSTKASSSSGRSSEWSIVLATSR